MQLPKKISNIPFQWRITGLFLVIVLLHGTTLLDYPHPLCDETFYSTNGLLYIDAINNGTIGEFSESPFFLLFGRIYFVIIGTTLRLLGQTLWASRFVSFISTLLVLLATYLLGSQYASRSVAIWSTALVGVAWTTTYTGHVARPDVLVVAVVMLNIALLKYLLDHQRTTGFALLGLSMTLALGLHMLPLHFILPITLLAVYPLIRLRQYTSIILMGVGLMTGLLVFGIIQAGPTFPDIVRAIVTDPSGFINEYTNDTTEGITSLPVLFGALQQYAGFWWQRYAWLAPIVSLPQAVLFLLGLGAALTPGLKNIRSLAIIVLISTVTFALLNRNYYVPGYALMWLPLYMVMGVAALQYIFRENRQLPAGVQQADSIILGGLFVLFFAGSLFLARNQHGDIYHQEAQQLMTYIPADSTVLAGDYWWYALNDDVTFKTDYLVRSFEAAAATHGIDTMLAVQAGQLTDVENADQINQAIHSLQDLDLDYVITDGVVGCAVIETTLASDAYFAQTCEYITDVETTALGTQVIYDCTGS